MNQNAALVLTGGLLVGGFVLGKSAIDHYAATQLEKKRISDEDVEEFEAQHYRAAGFTKKGTGSLDEVVMFVAAVGGIAYTVYQLPALIDELKQLGK